MIKYTTLWEILMKEFDPDQFRLMGAIHALRKINSGDTNSPLTQQQKEECLHDAEAAETLCERLGLQFSNMAINRMKDSLSQNTQISLKEWIKLSDELDNRIVDEMKSRKFLSLESDKALFLESADLFGCEVSKAFPSATFDIDEAGKCLVFERWTASVSHSMKILEVGLDVMAQSLGVAAGQQNWQTIIDQIEKEVRSISKTSGVDWKDKEQFYSEAALQFRHFKNAWRNHVMHPRHISYDEERATNIFNHVKEFMIHLAGRLHE